MPSENAIAGCLGKRQFKGVLSKLTNAGILGSLRIPNIRRSIEGRCFQVAKVATMTTPQDPKMECLMYWGFPTISFYLVHVGETVCPCFKGVLQGSGFISPPETNMAPTNWWCVDVSPFPSWYFRFQPLVSGGVSPVNCVQCSWTWIQTCTVLIRTNHGPSWSISRPLNLLEVPISHKSEDSLFMRGLYGVWSLFTPFWRSDLVFVIDVVEVWLT